MGETNEAVVTVTSAKIGMPIVVIFRLTEDLDLLMETVDERYVAIGEKHPAWMQEGERSCAMLRDICEFHWQTSEADFRALDAALEAMKDRRRRLRAKLPSVPVNLGQLLTRMRHKAT